MKSGHVKDGVWIKYRNVLYIKSYVLWEKESDKRLKGSF